MSTLFFIMAASEKPALSLVQPDDVAGKVDVAVGSAVAARHVHAVNCGHAARHRDSVQFAHAKCVLLEERLVVVAV